MLYVYVTYIYMYITNINICVCNIYIIYISADKLIMEFLGIPLTSSLKFVLSIYVLRYS